MTAVYSILRVKLEVDNEHTCQERKLLEVFMARSLVNHRPRGAHLVH
jgi:hypothetical protein